MVYQQPNNRLQITNFTSSPISGAITPLTNPTATPGFSAVNIYVLQQHPELAGATVVNVSTQVVAGTNWYITY